MFIVPRSQIIPVFSNDIYPVIDNPFMTPYDVTSPVVRHEVDIRDPASWLIYHVIIPHDRGAWFWFNPQVSFRAIRTQIGDVIGFPCPWLLLERGIRISDWKSCLAAFLDVIEKVQNSYVPTDTTVVQWAAITARILGMAWVRVIMAVVVTAGTISDSLQQQISTNGA